MVIYLGKNINKIRNKKRVDWWEGLLDDVSAGGPIKGKSALGVEGM